MITRARAARMKVEEGSIKLDCAPPGDLAAKEFLTEACDSSFVFLIPSKGAEEGGNAAEEGK